TNEKDPTMVEVKFGLKTVDLPYTIRIPNISEEKFDGLVDEDMKAELIDGIMVVHSPASTRHDDVAGFIRTLERMYAARKRLGKVLGPDSLVHLATCRMFAPDFFFCTKSRLPGRLRKKLFAGSPDQVGEVLSPSTRADDLDDKRPAYRQAGVGEIWIVDLDNQEVIVDRRQGRSYITEVLSQ